MGKVITKKDLSGITSADVIRSSWVLASDISSNNAMIPYYTANKKKMKFIKFDKRNLKDCKIKIHLAIPELSMDYVMVDPDGNVVKPKKKIKLGRKTMAGYTIPFKGFLDSLVLWDPECSAKYQRIYAIKERVDNHMFPIWDKNPYDLFIEFDGGKLVNIVK